MTCLPSGENAIEVGGILRWLFVDATSVKEYTPKRSATFHPYSVALNKYAYWNIRTFFVGLDSLTLEATLQRDIISDSR
jgi:hypothetical protein